MPPFSQHSHATQTTQWIPPESNWDSGQWRLPYGWELAIDDVGRPYFIKSVCVCTTPPPPHPSTRRAQESNERDRSKTFPSTYVHQRTIRVHGKITSLHKLAVSFLPGHYSTLTFSVCTVSFDNKGAPFGEGGGDPPFSFPRRLNNGLLF